MPHYPPTWTPERLIKLADLWDHTTLSAKSIAAKLGAGVTRNAVIGKARRLGLSSRDSPIIRNKIVPAKPKSVTIPAPHGCIKCQCGVYALPGLKRCYTCSERGSHA